MQLIGYELIPYEPLFWRKSADQISPECENIFKFDVEMIKKAQNLNAKFSLFCADTSEVVIANAAGAKLIVVDKQKARKFANLAEFYLFDAKIACVIEDESELDELASLRVDTAIFARAIVNEPAP